MQVTALFTALEAFCDPGVPNAQFPTDEDDARKKWAAAFLAYVLDIKASSGPPPPTGGVALAFYNALRFAPTLGAIPQATDLAAAWKAAMKSIFVFDGLDARETTLRGKLASIFAAPTLDAASRTKDIANAFDAVSNPITSGTGAITYT